MKITRWRGSRERPFDFRFSSIVLFLISFLPTPHSHAGSFLYILSYLSVLDRKHIIILFERIFFNRTNQTTIVSSHKSLVGLPRTVLLCGYELPWLSKTTTVYVLHVLTQRVLLCLFNWRNCSRTLLRHASEHSRTCLSLACYGKIAINFSVETGNVDRLKFSALKSR